MQTFSHRAKTRHSDWEIRLQSLDERTGHWGLVPGTYGPWFGGAEVGNWMVCTLCTPRASDSVVLGSDRRGFRMFYGLPSAYKAWNPVRVPPRARITPRQRGFCFNVWTLSHRGSL